MTEKKMRKYAVVDLEATGAHSSARIIQVGIVIIENGQIKETFATDVNPHQPLSRHISNLTGLTDEQLAQAPDFSQVAERIYELIADCIFVAHNVKFDGNLLAEALFFEGYDLLTPRIDTVELAQVFYPTLEKYSLSNLAQQLDLTLEDAHTAIADARATAQLFLKLEAKIASLPKLTLEKILTLADSLLYETSLVIQAAFEKASPRLAQDFEEVAGLVLRKVPPILKERQLSQDFATNIALLDLDERPKQEVFAQVIKERLLGQQVSFVEAQAGIGKTLGYLLPLLQEATNQQVLVTVPTKILQDQIMAKEARLLREVFQLNSHSLKSPQNYLKLDLFYQSLAQVEDNRLVNRYKMQLLVWLLETETGDLDEIRQKQRYAAYFDQIKHDGHLAADSLFADRDFWQVSYQRAQQSRLIITNHAYFLTRIEDDQAFVAGKTLVIDEAQKFFLNWEQFSRRHLNMTKLLQTIQSQLEQAQSVLQRRLLESLYFKVSHLIEHGRPNQGIAPETIALLRQDLAELDSPALSEVTELLDQRFDFFWLEAEQQDNHRQIILRSARLGLLDFSRFLPKTRKTYLVSATLQISPRVSLADLLGFKDYSFDRLPISPNQEQEVWIDKSMAMVDQLRDEDYEAQLAQRLLALAALQIPTLALFNAKKTMLAVSDLLDQAHRPHLTQDKNGHAFNVKKRFDRGETKLLLGTGSFWEGVDFVNQDKMIAVITRLPFDHPQDFLVKKVNYHLRQEGKIPFYDYTLPLAILRLKQAIGRTKRRDNQYSAVIILDSRVIKKNYGKMIEQALAENLRVSQQNFGQIVSAVRDFLI